MASSVAMPMSDRPSFVRGARGVATLGRFLVNPLDTIRDVSKKHGRLVVVDGFNPVPGKRSRQHVLALGPEFNRAVLGEMELYRITSQMPGGRGTAARRINYGLPRMREERHQRERQLLLPHFQKSAIEQHGPRMERIVSETLNTWRPGGIIDAAEAMTDLARHISAQILFGFSEEQSEDIGGALVRMLRLSVSPKLWFFPVNARGTAYGSVMRESERMERLLLHIIKTRRAHPIEHDDVLSILLRAYTRWQTELDDPKFHGTDEELVGQIFVLFGASYVTIGATLTWTLLLIAQHPQVAGRIVDEFESVIDDGPVTAEDLSRLTYLDMVVKEAMRILPPVPYSFRANNEETELGGLLLRRGARVLISQYFTHHMPELYEAPEEFRPDRWTTARPGPYDYLPFSAGQRMCLGGFYAMQVIGLTLVSILRRFHPKVVGDTRIDPHVSVMMRPRHPLPMELHSARSVFETRPVRGGIQSMVEFPQPGTAR